MGRLIDLTGKRFGKLVVLEQAESIRKKNGCTRFRIKERSHKKLWVQETLHDKNGNDKT